MKIVAKTLLKHTYRHTLLRHLRLVAVAPSSLAVLYGPVDKSSSALTTGGCSRDRRYDPCDREAGQLGDICLLQRH